MDHESRAPLYERAQWASGHSHRRLPACWQAGRMRALADRAAAFISAEWRKGEGRGRPMSAVRLMVPAHLSACGHLPAPWQAGAQAGRPRPETLRCEACGPSSRGAFGGMTKGRVAMLNFKFQSGFTLIELTIAITLVALMAVILYGAFHLGNRAVEKFQSRSEESQTLRASGELLAGYLRSAFPYRSSPRDPAIFFAGNEHELSFISALSRSLGGRGMSEIRIYWSDDGGRTGTLALEEKMPVRLESQADGGGYRSHIVLRQGIRDFRIEYQDSRGEGEDWVERWEGKERQALPRAVRLSYRGERGEKVEWVFPLMMTVLAP